MYIILGLITWVIILLVAWHDYERQHPNSMDEIWDVILIGGLIGGICAAAWPFTWALAIMVLLTHWLYKGYRSFMEPADPELVTEHDKG